jgi:hypothetical protein
MMRKFSKRVYAKLVMGVRLSKLTAAPGIHWRRVVMRENSLNDELWCDQKLQKD